MTSGFAAEQGEHRRREFRRMLWISGVAHALLFGSLLVTLPGPRRFAGTDVIRVDLIGPPARPRPAPAAPPAAPPKPKPKQVVLPAKPSEPKPAPKPRREIVPEPKPREEKSLDDLLAQFREEQGEPAPSPAPLETAAAPAATAGGAGAGVPVSPEVLAWIRKVKIKVMGAWVVPSGFRLQSLQTEVLVTLEEDGRVRGEPRIVRRSGNPWYDEGVVRGIEKASPLPRPPQSGEWTFIFASDESY